MRVTFLFAVVFFIWVLFFVAHTVEKEAEAGRKAASVQEAGLIPAE